MLTLKQMLKIAGIKTQPESKPLKAAATDSAEMTKDMIRNFKTEKPPEPTSDDIKCIYPSFGPDNEQNGYIVEFKRVENIGKQNGVEEIAGPGTQIYISDEGMKLTHHVAKLCRMVNVDAMRLLIPFLGEYNGRELSVNLKGLTPLQIVLLRKKLVEAGWPKEIPLVV